MIRVIPSEVEGSPRSLMVIEVADASLAFDLGMKTPRPGVGRGVGMSRDAT